jgi:glucose/arabinose dehydrogenase
MFVALFFIHVDAQDADNGADLYAEQCAECHGDNGEGGIGPSHIGCSICDSLEDLIEKIESDMPTTDPEDCTDDCSEDTAAYIFEVFNDNTIVIDPIAELIDKGTITIELETVASGLTAPVDLVSAGDDTGRLFIVDQAGKIFIIENEELLDTPFLDVTNRLVSPLGVLESYDENDYDERGLLGFAFHPGFADSESPGYQKVYTYTSEPLGASADFTTDTLPEGETFDHQSVIAEWTVDSEDPNRIDTSTRREVMRIDQPQFNHNGGKLAFGTDDYLYIGLGDGGSSNDNDSGHGDEGNGQNVNTVHGSILRIDPVSPELNESSSNAASSNGKYRIPSTNPFVSADGTDEIFAYGFRNPYRFSFDASSSQFIVPDVGQNNLEEINIVDSGNNYGWNLKEGTFAFVPDTGSITDNTDDLPGDLVDPVAQYDHDDGTSIIGGFTYRGNDIAGLVGKYVFGDFSTSFSTAGGRLFYADLTTGEIKEFIIGSDDRTLGLFLKGFGVDPDGDIYILASSNLGPYGAGGVVLKIVTASSATQDGDTSDGDSSSSSTSTSISCFIGALAY